MAGEVEDDNLRPAPPYRPEGPPQIVTADTARQGPLGKRALVVLLVKFRDHRGRLGRGRVFHPPLMDVGDDDASRGPAGAAPDYAMGRRTNPQCLRPACSTARSTRPTASAAEDSAARTGHLPAAGRFPKRRLLQRRRRLIDPPAPVPPPPPVMA